MRETRQSPRSNGEIEGGFSLAFSTKQQGQRFDKVAQEHSEDKAKSGGDLGWMSRGSMVSLFLI